MLAARRQQRGLHPARVRRQDCQGWQPSATQSRAQLACRLTPSWRKLTCGRQQPWPRRPWRHRGRKIGLAHQHEPGRQPWASGSQAPHPQECAGTCAGSQYQRQSRSSSSIACRDGHEHSKCSRQGHQQQCAGHAAAPAKPSASPSAACTCAAWRTHRAMRRENSYKWAGSARSVAQRCTTCPAAAATLTRRRSR